MKQFVVFMCPKCRNFTNSPLGQKRRRCSYCGTIIDIKKANQALFDSPEQALVAVKEFNAARGGDEFQKAVEQSRARFQRLLPDEPVNLEKIMTDDENVVLPGKRARLMTILEEESKERPCTLDRLEELCAAQGLSWEWVEKTVQTLSNVGALIFPRPWEIQLVGTAEDTSPKSDTRQDVSLEIISFLRTRKDRVRIDEIVRHFEERGISEDSVDSSLERLMRSGAIFQPVVGYVSLV
ncbi:MAG: hypothetical protein ACFFCT_06565 [Candidatus Odinarchaeota archaeon]|nr:hypothetical protein [Candidatus Thorarchaeota archaeon]